jgi:4-amino-4-deoxy-L-arabinose transferase-like glycosyltransferase
MKDSSARRSYRDPAVVFGLALAVALCVVFFVFHSQNLVDSRPDPYSFSLFGRRIARGEGFEGELFGRRGPFYPMVIGAIYWLFGEHEVLIQLMQCLAFAGTAVLAWDIGRQMYNGRTALFAGLLCAFHPSLLRYVPDFHLETFFTLLFTFSIWLSLRFYEQPSPINGALFGFVSGLTSLTKAVVMLYPPLFLAILWAIAFFSRKPEVRARKPSVIAAALVIGVMALTISPWTVRNYRVSGHFVPVSTGFSDAFLRGYVFSRTEFLTLRKPPYTDAENEVNVWFKKLCADEGAVWEKDAVQTEKILNKAAKAKLLADPLAFVRKSFWGIFAFWYEMTSLKTSLVAGVLALAGWFFTLFGVGRARREGRPQWLLFAPIIYLNGFLAILLALGRYSVPVLPCLMITAAFGLDTLATRFGVSWLAAEAVAKAPVATE